MSTTITAISQLLDALGRVPFITGVLTKGSLLILIAVGLTRLLARSPAAARHLVWTLSVAGLLLLPATALIPWRLELPVLGTARDAIVAPVTVKLTAAPDTRAESRRVAIAQQSTSADVEAATLAAESRPQSPIPSPRADASQTPRRC